MWYLWMDTGLWMTEMCSSFWGTNGDPSSSTILCGCGHNKCRLLWVTSGRTGVLTCVRTRFSIAFSNKIIIHWHNKILFHFYMHRNNQHQQIRFNITNTKPCNWTWSWALSIHLLYSKHIIKYKENTICDSMWYSVSAANHLINNKVLCAVSGDWCTGMRNTTGTNACSTPVVDKEEIMMPLFFHVLQSTQWAPGAISLGVQWLRSEADRSSPTGVEVKNMSLYTQSPIHIHGTVLNQPSKRTTLPAPYITLS